jgi:hypothetical protein
LRQHGDYLRPGQGLNTSSLLGVIVRSISVSLAVYLSLITIILCLLDHIHAFDPFWPMALFVQQFPLLASWETNSFVLIAVILLVFAALDAAYFSIRTRLSRPRKTRRYLESIRGQRLVGRLWALIIGVLVLGSLPHSHDLLKDVLRPGIFAGVLTVAGALLGVRQFIRQQTSGLAEEQGLAAGARIFLGAFMLVYGLLLAGYILADQITLGSLTFWILFWGAAALGLISDLNHSGLHRIYRDRLMELFLPDAQSVRDNEWNPATKAHLAKLEDMCTGESNRRPYQLINANIVLVNSPESRYRGRGGDSFLLSPLYCGSRATGWRRTDNYMMSKRLKNMYHGLTFATAMAISGAAANPNTGVAGTGVTRNPLVSTLMSLLNLRLGYRAPNPRYELAVPTRPNYIHPGIYSGVFWWGLHEESRSVELTDGGHFENLGLYELVRRRCKLILVSDGGADPEFKFDDLANAVERVRVDFGVHIEFSSKPDENLAGLRPGSAPRVEQTQHFELAKRGYALATIEYPQGKGEQPEDCRGTLVYLKSSVTPGLTEDIYGYKNAHPSFPDQATTDQFFGESQFEAYRELGYQLAMRLLRVDSLVPWPTDSDRPVPKKESGL